jgi:hypothetical protein
MVYLLVLMVKNGQRNQNLVLRQQALKEQRRKRRSTTWTMVLTLMVMTQLEQMKNEGILRSNRRYQGKQGMEIMRKSCRKRGDWTRMGVHMKL